MEWLLSNELPVGDYAERAVDWLTDNGEGVFDALVTVLDGFVGWILWALQTPHPLVVVAAFCLVAYVVRRSIPFTIAMALGMLYCINQDFWEETTETLALVLSASSLCMAIGVPIGIFLAHRPRAYSFVRPVLDLMQTLPTFVYLIPAVVFFGLGMVPGLIATIIFVVPAPIRLTQLGIAATPVTMLEAGRAFGANGWQLLTKVELPSALPQILAGLTQTIMLSLSMVVIAALVGADGLGVLILRALNTLNVGLGVSAGLAIVILAILLDRLFRPRRKKRS